jgi:type IV secretory pathway TrbF-like protein
MSEPFTSGPLSGNGHALPPVLSDEWQRIQAAYTEVQRRDSQAEYRAWRKDRLCLALLLALVIAVAGLVYLARLARQVQTLVQVVQTTPDGTLVQLGVPRDLLAYTPEEGVWLDMVGQWVQHVRWRSDNATTQHAHWSWVYRHTCASARSVLQALEAKEKPFEVGKVQDRLVTVQLKSVTKAAVPQSYQVLFVETATSVQAPRPVEQVWVATLSVGRLRPQSLEDALVNRLGLCVAGFAFDATPMGGR